MIICMKITLIKLNKFKEIVELRVWKFQRWNLIIIYAAVKHYNVQDHLNFFRIAAN
jgi:hypothetical protein